MVEVMSTIDMHVYDVPGRKHHQKGFYTKEVRDGTWRTD